jgi:glucose-6-phosphate isomerase
VTFNKHNPLSLKSWKLLESNFQKNAQKKITDYFAEDTERVKKLSLQWESFYVDYSKNLLDQETLDLLISVAEESGLNQAIEAYFDGGKINETEDRAVLHTALRQLSPSSLTVDGKNITPKIEEVKKQMFDFADQVISGAWKGHTGKPSSMWSISELVGRI